MVRYPVNHFQFFPDFVRQNATGKTASVACLTIALEYRGKGIASAFLESAVIDSIAEGFMAVEGYVHLKCSELYYGFHDLKRQHEKAWFVEIATVANSAIMRELLC
jgi:GNAT superfamily N-acetyltransferase